MMPTLFLSHGSPMHALEPGAAGAAWQALARRVPRPRAVLIASAHWESELPLVATTARPETLHDFRGFPEPLYGLRYPAPGAPDVAQRALELVRAAGLHVAADGSRGLDHGAWVPLMRLYPDADVPVAQISIQPTLDAAHHAKVGAALSSLRREDVLVIGSGHMTHNLRDWMAHAGRHGMKPGPAAAAPYVEAFRAWVDDALHAGDLEAIVKWRERAPHAPRAHPTDEHFLPLPFAFAAAGAKPRIEHIDAGVDAGVLAMDAYLFWPEG